MWWNRLTILVVAAGLAFMAALLLYDSAGAATGTPGDASVDLKMLAVCCAGILLGWLLCTLLMARPHK